MAKLLSKGPGCHLSLPTTFLQIVSMSLPCCSQTHGLRYRITHGRLYSSENYSNQSITYITPEVFLAGHHCTVFPGSLLYLCHIFQSDCTMALLLTCRITNVPIPSIHTYCYNFPSSDSYLALCPFPLPLLIILNISPFLNLPYPSSWWPFHVAIPSVWNTLHWFQLTNSPILCILVTCLERFSCSTLQVIHFFPVFPPCLIHTSPSLESELLKDRNCVLFMFMPLAPNLLPGLWQALTNIPWKNECLCIHFQVIFMYNNGPAGTFFGAQT